MSNNRLRFARDERKLSYSNRQRAGLEFVLDELPLTVIANRLGIHCQATADVIRRRLYAMDLTADERKRALQRLEGEVTEVINRRAGKAVVEVEEDTQTPEVDDLARRVAALEPKSPPQRLCAACGVLSALDGGREVEGRWVCRAEADLLDAEARLDDLRDWGVSARLRLDHRRIGSGALCGIALHYETALVPNAVPWGHLDRAGIAAAFDREYGRRVSGPRVVLHRPVIGEETIVGRDFRATVPKLGPAVPVVLDPDAAVTFARGPRPATADEIEAQGRRDTIARKRRSAGRAVALRARKASALAAVERRFRRVS